MNREEGLDYKVFSYLEWLRKESGLVTDGLLGDASNGLLGDASNNFLRDKFNEHEFVMNFYWELCKVDELVGYSIIFENSLNYSTYLFIQWVIANRGDVVLLDSVTHGFNDDVLVNFFDDVDDPNGYVHTLSHLTYMDAVKVFSSTKTIFKDLVFAIETLRNTIIY